jgi:outer membrane protein assembly factor BamB/tetratricopeptide (TPR) repeat protein
MTVALAGRPAVPFRNAKDGLDFLTQAAGKPSEVLDGWTMFRGDPARNAAMVGSTPLLNLRWQIPTAGGRGSSVETLLDQWRDEYRKRGLTILPGLHPLAAGNLVLMRTYANLLAVDLRTGKRIWEVSTDDPIENILAAGGMEGALARLPQLRYELANRMWRDAAYGTLSSDGHLVFSIEDLPLQVSQAMPMINRPDSIAAENRLCNRLAAHEIATGRLKWHIGGPDDQFALRYAKTFFLGPPLALMGRLYVLAEVKDEIHLMALDAKTGERTWWQRLATTDGPIDLDPTRRRSGVSPSFGDGILVCPTSLGAVVAVDLASRSLVWGYRYGRHEATARNVNAFIAPFPIQHDAYPQDRWADSTVTMARGRVLLTPADSQYLHCLDPQTGELLWRLPRGDSLYLAHVYDDTVVVVGRRQVRAYSLSQTRLAGDARQDDDKRAATSEPMTAGDDANPFGEGNTDEAVQQVPEPKPVWGPLDLPEGAFPAGRGFFTSGHYFLPVSTAEVLAIDLKTGTVTHRSRSRSGIVPGNLVCYQGRVVSQGYNSVEAFDQLDFVRQDVEQRLKANPADPRALRLRGEILLDDGKHAEAIACFQKSYEADKAPETRDVLRQAMLDALRADFKAHRQRTGEMETLLDTPLERSEFLRLMARGCREAGEWEAALAHCLKLVDLEPDAPPLERVSKSHLLRRDRWVQVELASLFEAAGDPSALDRPIKARLDAALAKGDAASLKRFLTYFGNLPVAGEARRRLVQQLAEAGRFLEAEMTLWSDYESADPAVAAAATAELGELLAKAGRPDDAAVCYRRLAREFPDVACKGGKTGRQLRDDAARSEPVGRHLTHGDPWPTGKVLDRVEPAANPESRGYGPFVMAIDGDPGPFFREKSLRYDQQSRRVSGIDPLGHTAWQTSVAASNDARLPSFHPTLTYGLIRGHLLLVSMQYRVAAIDTLGSPAKKAALLWDKDVTDEGSEVLRLGGFQLINPAFAFGHRSVPWTNLVGPVTSRYACFQRFRNLTAVDPLTGDVLWSQDEVDPQSAVFGDDRFVFAVAPDSQEALVFRASDGKLLGRRPVPRKEQFNGVLRPFPELVLAPLGSRLLLWDEDSGEPELRLYDVWEQKDAWPPRKFAAGAAACMVGHEAVGVLEPSGRMVLIALPGGKVRFDTPLGQEQGLTEFWMLPSADGYAVVTHCPSRDPKKNTESAALPKQIQSGHVYMLDAQGKPAWPKPYELHEQSLTLTQPCGLPLLTFAQLRSEPGQKSVSIVCLDKRTGRASFQGRVMNATGSNYLEISGDPAEKRIELEMQGRAVLLTLTGESPSRSESLLHVFRATTERRIDELMRDLKNKKIVDE